MITHYRLCQNTGFQAYDRSKEDKYFLLYLHSDCTDHCCQNCIIHSTYTQVTRIDSRTGHRNSREMELHRNRWYKTASSKSKCFYCGRWASDRGSRCANVNIVVEWNGMLAEGTRVKWLRKQRCENNKSLFTHFGLVAPYVDINLGRHLLI